jgi:hypothetical protein
MTVTRLTAQTVLICSLVTTVIGAVPVSAAAAPVVVARYAFDQRLAGARVDNSGHGHTLRIVAAHGGSARSVVRGRGLALAFPPACTGSRCPQIVLQAASAAELNPGTRPLRYGASVLLPRGQTSSGENVLQKGYSARGGQYKLQIDGRAGKPSCAMVDSRKSAIRLARSAVTVADNRWHRLECRRIGTRLSILVDGLVRGGATIPLTLSVSNAAPLSIAGKGAYPDNDQFHGVLDDVWVAIG